LLVLLSFPLFVRLWYSFSAIAPSLRILVALPYFKLFPVLLSLLVEVDSEFVEVMADVGEQVFKSGVRISTFGDG
jgi:hypothetical protein